MLCEPSLACGCYLCDAHNCKLLLQQHIPIMLWDFVFHNNILTLAMCVCFDTTWITIGRQMWFMRHYPHEKLCQYKRWLWGASSSVDVIASSLATILTSPTVSMSCFMGIGYGFYTSY
uniref:Uncharacterized protein n=1 Tax=Picea glauca TaxID=3330 RepID=A0A117NH78_PICGL|nr:hypothetical protein ABT39_MTgene4955 [Picea glauca]QHR90385.1 hypothetical protein Q903MT_gene4408 [Picea sitchensis]